jgi:hypothetical protein
LRRTLTVLLMLGSAAFSLGCSYLQNRAGDAADIIDLGFTVSKKAQFAAFTDAPFMTIWPLGYGNVDGRFVGVGQGGLRGFSPMHERSVGFVLWGEEKLSYRAGKADLEEMDEEERAENEEFYRTGFLGFAEGPAPPPKYLFSCPHYLHLGWVGIVATPRYFELLDFVLGWTTIDICSDDTAGKQR